MIAESKNDKNKRLTSLPEADFLVNELKSLSLKMLKPNKYVGSFSVTVNVVVAVAPLTTRVPTVLLRALEPAGWFKVSLKVAL